MYCLTVGTLIVTDVLNFGQKLYSLRMIYFFNVLLDCNYFEINISYSFRDVKTNKFTMPTASYAVDHNLKYTYVHGDFVKHLSLFVL